MRFLSVVAFGLHFRGLLSQTLDANGVSLDDKVLAIERVLLTPGTIDFPVTPCDFNLNSAPNNISGDQTAAQWVRTVFHDFITADTKAGTGGLDASIGFEADRDENLGITFKGTSFINETIIGFNLFAEVYISTADFIALGLAASLNACDSGTPLVKLRAGRIDATGPGPTGVPKPQDSLTSATDAFAKAGFSKTEMIQAVACGHSIGSVHKIDFPEIGRSVSPPGTGADTFDSTPFKFDNTQVQEYLTGTGKRGGPLVTTKNVTMQSDLRIFKSDNNVTVKAMSSAASFRNTCLTIFEKMLNTVPAGTTLSNPIGPRPWITKETHLDLSPSGVVRFSGNISTQSKAAGAAPATASYVYLTNSGNTAKAGNSQAGLSEPFGKITYYSFNDTIPAGVTSIKIQNSYTENINMNLFIMPSQSFINQRFNPNGSAGIASYLVRAALLTSLATSGASLTGTFYFPSPQPNSAAPKWTRTTFTLTKEKTLGSYTIFKGQVSEPGVHATGTGLHHIDVQFGSIRSPKVIASFFTTESFFGNCSDFTKC
ncbi:heme peroxidase [Polyplosphaeria fusca]|uniref:Peroxidase n=1 Tax=Polyplosphaeria fusca TaxID=682080 RepID=A0A9P4R1G3_9PLEO|nr:heme peroxidase [Polyplosphaeria fusca]